MVENGKVAIIHADALFRAIRDYKPTSSSSSGQSQYCKIRKVQLPGRPQENTSPYTPKIIFIGPLHHGEDELKAMVDLKHKYLNKLLNRRGGDQEYEPSSDGKNDELLGRFIAAARNMEEKVRGCYELSNTNTISSDDFVRMLVIDGCFLIEVLIRGNSKRKIDDLGLHGPLINHDILLFENQIPFFVLQAFYKILREYGVDECSTMVEVAYRYLYLNKWENHMTFLGSGDDSVRETSNLLHLYHMMLFNENHSRPPSIDRKRILGDLIMESFPWPPFIDLITIVRKWTMALFSWLFVIVSSSMYFIHKIFFRKWTMALFSWLFVILSSPMYFIHKIFFADITHTPYLTSATEIEEAGVRLQGSRVDLRFEQGTLLVPILTLNQQSLRLLKNLMIFEFYFRGRVPPYVHEYVSYLSLLIKNPGDLKVMEKHHIIRTSVGGHESFELVADLLQAGFETLAAIKEELMFLRWQDRFDIHYHLGNYCEKRRHWWWAKLMKDYFGNPWSTLGVLTGVILLVLATLQTLFTVLSYYHQ